MKSYHLTTAILIIFQLTQISGQDFAPIGAEWYYSSSAYGAAPTASEYYYLLAEKDTTIKELNLRKIKRTYCSYQGDSIEVSPYLLHLSGDTVSLYDKENEKLYRLFVFNVSQGDTLLLDIPHNNHLTEDSTYRVVIDTIETETYDGTELNRYVLEQLDNFGWFSGFYLEKVGGYEWFLPLGKTTIPEDNGPIRCYRDNEIDVKFSSLECDYRVVNSIDAVLTNRIELFPNPTSNHVQIKTDLRVKYIEVIDLAGHVVLQTKKTDLNITSFPGGVYFIRIHTDDRTVTKRIIKE